MLPVRLLRLSDGKRGHDNQTLGLIAALAKQVDIDCETLHVDAPKLAWWRRFPWQTDLLNAQGHRIILAAGHGTHMPALLLKRRYKARCVVLMRPSLPRTWFDLCIVPRHDEVREGPGCLVTEGVLNRIVPRDRAQSPARALVLLGGPSKEFLWDDELVANQVSAIAEQWSRPLLATSRRTPHQTIERLRQLAVEIVPFDTVEPDWLVSTMPRCNPVWVSMDSASMVYESLSSGADTGIIELPPRSPGRVERGLKQLKRAGRIVSFSDWRAGAPIPRNRSPLNEAERCAEWIVDQWLSG